MTVLELMQKDFQEVFPAVIGNAENQLSIEELVGESDEYILGKLESIKVGYVEKAEFIGYFKLVQAASEATAYDSSILYKLKRFSEKHPDCPSFRYFLYMYWLTTIFVKDDFSIENLTLLFQRILNDEALMHLTDFVIESRLGRITLILTESTDEMISLFMDACTKYPQKTSLLWLTAHLFFISGRYQEALHYNLQCLQKLESIENYDTDFVDDNAEVIVKYQIADLYYRLSDYDNSLHYCEKIHELWDGKKNESPDFQWDVMIIKLNIHRKRQDVSSFSVCYNKLKEVLNEDELKDHYPDLVDFARLFKI